MSGDRELRKVGSVTGIDYAGDFYRYVEFLEAGIIKNKASIRKLFKEWDTALFPKNVSVHGTKHGCAATTATKEMGSLMEELDNDEDAETDEDESNADNEETGGQNEQNGGQNEQNRSQAGSDDSSESESESE